ncbi:hypothetical protein CFP65_1805 [Kitasatospora sp. MMS16-BH015]|uniref:tetratricopeptide repeat protein n=1 Tax=Kitasatospora sp. MMS16-BH015 TaxID=2018025 RepID=UPI000CA1C606|nr:tetratricopeptide repeat protein [Kitasatospora sp. MMS16-BH015]AUG76679.1 hypothetical protein CFP65_1805 [Kitasatospora sp. MMS16-BH015]
MFAGLRSRARERDLRRADRLLAEGHRFEAAAGRAQAEPAYRKAVELLTARLGGEASATLAARVRWADTLAQLARREEAAAELRAALVHCPAVLGEDHPSTCNARRSLATLLLLQGHPEEALELTETVLRRRPAPDVLGLAAWDVRLRALGSLGRHREAADAAPALRERLAQAYGADDLRTLKIGADRAQHLVQLGEYETAEHECRELIELRGAVDLFQLAVTNALVLALVGLGRHEEAEAAARKALTRAEGDVGISLALGLARSLRGSGRHEDAWRAAADAKAKFLLTNPRPVLAAPVHTVLAQTLLGIGHLPQAEAEAHRAVELAATHLTPAHHSTLEAATTLGTVLAATDRRTEAIEHLTRCAAAWREHYGPDHPRTRATEAELAALA